MRYYFISNNYDKKYKSITAARKAVMARYKGFQLRAVSVPILDQNNRNVGYVNEPGTYPEWRVPYKRFNPNINKTVILEKRWVLKADGTLGKRLN